MQSHQEFDLWNFSRKNHNVNWMHTFPYETSSLLHDRNKSVCSFWASIRAKVIPERSLNERRRIAPRAENGLSVLAVGCCGDSNFFLLKRLKIVVNSSWLSRSAFHDMQNLHWSDKSCCTKCRFQKHKTSYNEHFAMLKLSKLNWNIPLSVWFVQNDPITIKLPTKISLTQLFLLLFVKQNHGCNFVLRVLMKFCEFSSSSFLRRWRLNISNTYDPIREKVIQKKKSRMSLSGLSPAIPYTKCQALFPCFLLLNCNNYRSCCSVLTEICKFHSNSTNKY